MSTFFSRLWNMGSCCTGRSNKLARDAERARETLEEKKLEDAMRQDVENELQQRKMGQMALGVQGRVQVSQIMNGAQPALTKQQLNEQIQNLNKLLASPDRKHRNEEIFQLLKTINRSAHKHNDKPIIKFSESGSECYAILDNLLNDELLSDEDGNKNRCVFCTSAGTTHYLDMSKLRNVRIVSPLETKLYCDQHDIKMFNKATGTPDYIHSNKKLKGISSIPIYTNNGRDAYLHKEFQPVHEFKDGSKFISGIVSYHQKITSCPGIAYNELQAHPESLQINHCNGYTENDYRDEWKGGCCYPQYYTGNSATDPDRGFYFMNNNKELVKCGDFPKDFKFRHDELNELFGLGEYAQQPAAGLDDIIDDAEWEDALEKAGILPPDQQAQQPVVNSDSESDLPAEAPSQGARPAEVEDSDLDSDSDSDSDLPAEAPIQGARPAEVEDSVIEAQPVAAQQAQQPVANDNAQPAQQPVVNSDSESDLPAEAPIQGARPAEVEDSDLDSDSDSDSGLPAEAQIQGARPTEVEDSVIEAQPVAAQQAQQPVANDNAQPAQQPVVNSDSESDSGLPAEAQIQGARPTEVEDSVIEAQPAQQPAEAPVIEEEPVAKPAEEPAAEEPAADEPVANNNAQPAQPAQPAAAAPQQAADEQPTIIKSNRDAEIKLYNANGRFRSGSIEVAPGDGRAEVTYADNTKAYIYLQNGARIHRSNSITVEQGDSATIITPDESTTYAQYQKQTKIHRNGSFDF